MQGKLVQGEDAQRGLSKEKMSGGTCPKGNVPMSGELIHGEDV